MLQYFLRETRRVSREMKKDVRETRFVLPRKKQDNSWLFLSISQGATWKTK